jgi:hypothetical protein
MMRIAIIDGVNQDIGLKILFPHADYYIDHVELDKSRSISANNIDVKKDWSKINDENYDVLFVIIALYDAKPNTKFFKQNIYDILQRELAIINKNNFKKVCVFDNYDYDYDPNEIVSNGKIDLFFKRNYNKTKLYNPNVVPFPFIMFGEVSIIEKINCTDPSQRLPSQSDPSQSDMSAIEKIPRIIFSGSLFIHDDPQIGHYRNRKDMYNKIGRYIFNPGYLAYDTFLKQIKMSMFALDLNGVGDPNKRTFEILSQGTLMIGEYNNLKWPFEERFSEETIFANEHEFFNKIEVLIGNPEIYKKCLDNQNEIYKKYFNKEWISNYIVSKLA